MKIKISKILLVLSVCGLLYSCDKFFEVDLKGQMDEEKVVNNEDYLAKLWAGLYWAMENGFTAVGNGGYASACDEADNNQQSSSVAGMRRVIRMTFMPGSIRRSVLLTTSCVFPIR